MKNAVTDFGAVPDGKTDSWLALENAINNTDGKLLIPAGVYYCSQQLQLQATVRIEGECGPFPNGLSGTVLKFAPGQGGLVATRQLVNGLATGVGDRCLLDGLYFLGQGGPATAHGLTVNSSRFKAMNCSWLGFGGDGIHIEADTPATPDPANANYWRLTSVEVALNGGNGLHVNGPNCNAGFADHVWASSNKGWAVLEEDTLGNKFHCGCDGNAGGAFNIGGNSSFSLMDCCYSEGGQPPSMLGQYAMSLGGDHGAGWVPNPPGYVIAPGPSGQGLQLPRLYNLPLCYGYAPGTRLSSGTHPPTAGTWPQGWIILNAQPSHGNPIGWVCTVAGTPGTWVSLPNL